MRAVSIVIAVLAGMAGASAGCGACEPGKGAADGSATAEGGSAPAAASVTPWRPAPVGSRLPRELAREMARSARAPCRIMGLDGDVRAEKTAESPEEKLAVDGAIPRSAWLLLAPDSGLVARDPRTTRETTFRGPGRARGCVDRDEESWLASGVFESSVGAGETPGAEEWVMTPLGVVRYGAAKLALQVGPQSATLAVSQGVAFVWTAEDTRGLQTPPDGEGWVRVENGRAVLLPKAPKGARDAAAAATAVCTRLAQESHTLAAALLGAPPGPPPDGGGGAGANSTGGGGANATGGAGAPPATQQVRARRLARAACGVALLRAQALPPADGDAVLPAVRAADSAWRSLPSTDE